MLLKKSKLNNTVEVSNIFRDTNEFYKFKISIRSWFYF